MTVGRYTYGTENIQVLWPHATVSIGAFCSIAEGLTIFAGGEHRLDRVTTYPFGHLYPDVFPHAKEGHPKTRGPVRIGNDVWIGAHVSIMSGVRIGDGAAIGAYSHVVSHVKPYAVVGGNPAQVYYYRYPPDVIAQLLKLRWWNLPDETIREILPLLTATNVKPLLKWWSERTP